MKTTKPLGDSAYVHLYTVRADGVLLSPHCQGGE